MEESGEVPQSAIQDPAETTPPTKRVETQAGNSSGRRRWVPRFLVAAASFLAPLTLAPIAMTPNDSQEVVQPQSDPEPDKKPDTQGFTHTPPNQTTYAPDTSRLNDPGPGGGVSPELAKPKLTTVAIGETEPAARKSPPLTKTIK